MPVGLKAVWEVKAGLTPGQELALYTKQWLYTTEDDAADRAANPNGDPAYHSILAKKRAEALDYYLQVSLPQLNNWARLDFIWL